MCERSLKGKAMTSPTCHMTVSRYATSRVAAKRHPAPVESRTASIAEKNSVSGMDSGGRGMPIRHRTHNRNARPRNEPPKQNDEEGRACYGGLSFHKTQHRQLFINLFPIHSY